MLTWKEVMTTKIKVWYKIYLLHNTNNNGSDQDGADTEHSMRQKFMDNKL
jgi:hypothetical protein